MRQIDIAIVGGGPSAIYALDALASALPDARTDLRIAVFDPSDAFGGGDTYACDQPPYCVMNRDACDIALAPRTSGLTFLEWLAQSCPPDQATAIAPGVAPPRALVGHAFAAVFASTRRYLTDRAGLRVLTIARAVAGISETRDGSARLALTLEGDTNPALVATHVLLATGHDRLVPSEDQHLDMQLATCRPGLAYVPRPYPLRYWPPYAAPAGGTVALRGMGLSAIDAVLHLTEGRGGRFDRTDGDGLRYRPSGQEPRRIVCTGTSGLPVTARPANMRARQGAAARPLCLLTSARIDALRTARGGQLDFRADVLPAIVGEMAILFHTAGDARVAETALAPVGDAALDALGAANCRCPDPADRVAARIDRAARDMGSLRRFDWRNLLTPSLPTDTGNWHGFALRRAREDLRCAQTGNLVDPVKAAIDGVWRDGRVVLSAALDFAGLAPESEADFRRTWLRVYHRFSNGAPVTAMEKLVALAEADLVDFGAGPGARIRRDRGRNWCVEGPETGYSVAVDTLIEARIEGFDPERSITPLYRDMIGAGLLRYWRNGSSCVPGFRSIAIDPLHRALRPSGDPDPRITLVGTPIEGTRYFQESLARPQSTNATLEALSHWAARIAQDLPCSGT